MIAVPQVVGYKSYVIVLVFAMCTLHTQGLIINSGALNSKNLSFCTVHAIFEPLSAPGNSNVTSHRIYYNDACKTPPSI